MIHQDPPTVVRGPAVGDNQSVANGSNLDIQPSAGEEWFIELIILGAACDLKWSDGTNPITFTSYGAKDTPNSLEKLAYTVTHDDFIRITNTGLTSRFGYSGYKLLT